MTPSALLAAQPSGALGALVSVHERLGDALLVVLAAGVVLGALAVRNAGLLPTVRAYLWLAFAAVALQGVGGSAWSSPGSAPTRGST